MCRFQRPRGLRRGSRAARLLGLWVRLPPGAWMSVVSVVCCQVEVSATGPGKSYRLWCVVVCDLETSRMRRPASVGPQRHRKKENLLYVSAHMCHYQSASVVKWEVYKDTILRTPRDHLCIYAYAIKRCKNDQRLISDYELYLI